MWDENKFYEAKEEWLLCCTSLNSPKCCLPISILCKHTLILCAASPLLLLQQIVAEICYFARSVLPLLVSGVQRSSLHSTAQTASYVKGPLEQWERQAGRDKHTMKSSFFECLHPSSKSTGKDWKLSPCQFILDVLFFTRLFFRR